MESTAQNTAGSLLTLTLALALLIVLFLIFREVVCWYWRINQSVALLTEIRDLLVKASPTPARQEPTGVSLSDAKASFEAAQNLAATGHSASAISKELQQWRGLSSEVADDLAKRALAKR